MRRRIVLAVMSLAVVLIFTALHIQAEGPGETPAPQTEVKSKDKLTLDELILAQRFNEFQQMMLRLKHRLERSPKKEDRDRAVILQRVLDQAKNSSLNIRFEQMVDFLKKGDFGNLENVKKARDESLSLAEEMRRLLAMLREDPNANRLREKRTELEKLVKEIQRLIRDQKVVQGQTQEGQMDPKDIKSSQKDVTQRTDQVAKSLGDKASGQGSGKDGELPKSEAKAGGKGDGMKGEGKGDSKEGGSEARTGQGKEGSKGSDPAQAKGGAGKEGSQSGQGSKDNKSGQGQEGSQSGQGKGKDGGEGKEGGKAGAKGGDNKEGSKAGGSKGGEGSKAGDSKAGDSKGGDGSKAGSQSSSKSGGEGSKSGGEGSKSGGEGSKSGSKGGSKSGGQSGSKAGGSKAGDNKAGSQNDPISKIKKIPEPNQHAEAKPGDNSSGKGDAKKAGDDKQGGTQQAQAKSGGSQGGSQSGQQGGSSGGSQGGGQQQQQNPEENYVKKKVQDANEYQKSAEDNIAKREPGKAVDNQDKAIQNLQDAKKKLEDLIRQMREEELERLLADLEARCQRMLVMQIRVLEGTVGLAQAITANPDKKASRFNERDSLKLSDDEKDIVLEATKAIEMLEADGSGVAFPEVFKQVREDMKNVSVRLGIVDTGKVTVAIEEDIVSTLKEMIDALKKAQQDLKDKKSKSGQSGQQGPPPDQKLLELIAELKLIRSMQIRVNQRTTRYGKTYEGEQAAEAQIRRELQQLADRQERIFEVTNRLAKGDNR